MISSLLQSKALHIWAVMIAVVLWFQVHGQGEGSLNMEVTLQLQGLPQNMVVVNDLPSTVHVTLSGLQGRLKTVSPQDVYVPFDASGLNMPGVVERAVKIEDIRLPAGLDIEKIQPDRIELQIDRVVEKSITVLPRLELPEGWQVEIISVEPAEVKLSGPEVWLDSLSEVETTAIQPEFKPGPFEAVVGVASPTGKAIRLVNEKAKFMVKGILTHQEMDEAVVNGEIR
ncbi:MAG: CdaR family protein [Mariprofundaceae bacterium]